MKVSLNGARDLGFISVVMGHEHKGGVERFMSKKRPECKKADHFNFGRGRGLHRGGRKETSRVTEGKLARPPQGGGSCQLSQILQRGHPA